MLITPHPNFIIPLICGSLSCNEGFQHGILCWCEIITKDVFHLSWRDVTLLSASFITGMNAILREHLRPENVTQKHGLQRHASKYTGFPFNFPTRRLQNDLIQKFRFNGTDVITIKYWLIDHWHSKAFIQKVAINRSPSEQSGKLYVRQSAGKVASFFFLNTPSIKLTLPWLPFHFSDSAQL